MKIDDRDEHPETAELSIDIMSEPGSKVADTL
jgi:hypothetical protein